MDNPSHEGKLAQLREIVKRTDICMLTTVDENGDLHSRPLSNNRDVDFDGDLWFFIEADSHKAAEVGREPRVNASFADIDGRRYASITGRAEVVTDRSRIEELWKPILKAWFPEGPDTPGIALLRVHAERAEYWDASANLLAQAVQFAAKLLTGQQADYGDNERLKLG